MQLIYRGEQIEYHPAPAKPYRKPRALNWRYHAPGETYSDIPLPQPTLPRHTRQPRALNWRWQATF